MINLFHIIIVDDEDVTRGNLEKRIAWDKLDVSVAAVFSNGISALEYCRNTMPDIVLTDVKMPKMDGITLATELRKLSSTCKFIFLSGFADKDYLKSAIHLQALTYIEKPIQLNEVTQAIALAVEQCRREQIEQKNRFRGLFLQYQQMTLALISTSDKNESVDKFGKIYLDFSTWAQYTVGYLTPNLQLPES
ncbi:MAG: response regulator, partial [Ruthenibacterium sp.]